MSYQKTTGFTLVETLVAVGILVLAVTGAFSAARSGLLSFDNSKNQTIAINLAQEAIEYIHSVRDTNKINNRSWLDGLSTGASTPCTFTNTCIVSVLATSENASCGANSTIGSCPVIRQNPSTGYYTYAPSSNPTIFRREIQIREINPGKEVSVLVSVTWGRGVTLKQYKTREYLFNW